MGKTLKKLAGFIKSENLFAQLNYNYLRLKFGKFPKMLNISRPQRFSEKIVWLKCNYRAPGASTIADKYRARRFVAERVSEDILVPLYGCYENVEDIDFSNLPRKFVAKPNHASGMIEFCESGKIDESALRKTFQSWLDSDYGKDGREYQYKDIPRRILFEQNLSELAGTKEIEDFKFFCFNGEPKFVQVDLDRMHNHTRNFYDLDWRRLPFRLMFPNADKEVDRPSNLVQMIDIARRLSAGMVFARIDLYEVCGRVYFGEITLHPEGGIAPIWPERYDVILGEKLVLPSK